MATVRIERDRTVKPDPLFEHSLTRRSVREPFDTERVVSESALRTLVQIADPQVEVDGTTNPGMVAELRQLTAEAWRVEWTHRPTREETVAVTRIGNAGLAFHPLSQPLQELPEMAPHYRRVHALLAEPGHTAQMLARLIAV